MGSSVVIDQTLDRQTFATAVLEASHDRPVLVDFFATWCGPCQLLKPILEKLAQEYDLTLAKVDIDQYPDLATQYHVDGVPDVRLVVAGEVKPGFVGMLPEPQLRELLGQWGLRSSLETAIALVETLVADKRYPEAKVQFDHLFDRYPGHGAVAIAAARFLLQIQKPEDALQILRTIEVGDSPHYEKAQGLKGLAELHALALAPVDGSEETTGELAQAFSRGAQSAVAGDYDTALNTFLEIVGRDRKFRNDGARKAMVTLFDCLGPDHDLTQTYRKRLMQTLY